MEQIIIEKSAILSAAIDTSAWKLYAKGDAYIIEDHAIHQSDSAKVYECLPQLFPDIERAMYPLLRDMDMTFFVTSDSESIYVAIPDYITQGTTSQSKPKDNLAAIIFDAFVSFVLASWFEDRGGEATADLYQQVTELTNTKLLELSKFCVELWHHKTKQDIWK